MLAFEDLWGERKRRYSYHRCNVQYYRDCRLRDSHMCLLLRQHRVLYLHLPFLAYLYLYEEADSLQIY
jgi:hypothetical protein